MNEYLIELCNESEWINEYMPLYEYWMDYISPNYLWDI